ncbi:hypothetical protein ACWEQN_35460 [Streptomyces sp. NPDC004129]
MSGGMDANPGIIDEPLMAGIGRDIFYDLAWQHEAFLDAPDTIVELASLHDTYGQFPTARATSYSEAWKKIASDDPDQVAAGNRDLLQNEQWTIIQPRYDALS